MLGYRGIRRSLDRPETFRLELEAFRRLYDMGYDNVELMLLLVTDAEDVLRAKAIMEDVGLDPEKRSWGVMVETPASALSIESICEAGIDFASFGTNDLTQYTPRCGPEQRERRRPVRRTPPGRPRTHQQYYRDPPRARRGDEHLRPAGSKPEMVRHLVNSGVTSISANIDAVHDVQQEVKRVEQRLPLESVR